MKRLLCLALLGLAGLAASPASEAGQPPFDLAVALAIPKPATAEIFVDLESNAAFDYQVRMRITVTHNRQPVSPRVTGGPPHGRQKGSPPTWVTTVQRYSGQSGSFFVPFAKRGATIIRLQFAARRTDSFAPWQIMTTWVSPRLPVAEKHGGTPRKV